MSGFLNVCRFLATSAGTGDFIVAAAITGYQTPSSAGAVNGRIYSYRAESADLTQWEIGQGVYTTSSTTLARTKIIASSTGSKINFSAPPQVGVVALAEDLAGVSQNVRAWGAVGDGSTDDTAAFNAAIAALIAQGGGELSVPPGTYCLNSGIVVGDGIAPSTQSIRMVGASTYSTILTANGHDVTLVTLNGFYSSIENMSLWGKAAAQSPTISTETFGATHPTIQINATAGTAKLSYLNVLGGSRVLYLNGAVEPRIEHCSFAFGYGDALVYAKDTIALKAQQMSCDQAWPVSLPATGGLSINARANSTAYSVGDVVSSGGYWLQCRVAGTSGGSAPTLKNYGVDITDGGTLKWQLVGPAGYYGMQLDTGCIEIFLTKMDFSGSYWAGLAITNSAAGTAPVGIHVEDSVFSVSAITMIYAIAGSSLYLMKNRFVGALNPGSATINLSISWAGEAVFIGNRFIDSPTAAIAVAAGTSTLISGNFMYNNGTGVDVSANIVKFNISNNVILNSSVTPIRVNSGTSDYYSIVGNIVGGASITDSGSGTHKTVSGNN